MIGSRNGFAVRSSGNDMSIVPTLDHGVKIADFTVGKTSGELYAPDQTNCNLSGLSDVGLSALTDGQVLAYDATAGKWKNVESGGGGGIGSGYTLTVISDPEGIYSSDITALLADGSCVKAGLNYGGDAVINNVVAFIEDGDGGIRTAGFLVQNTTVYYGPGCFVKGMMILLSDGTEKPVEEITFDDKLAVWDFDNGKMSTSTPLWIKKEQTTDHLWVNKFEDGREILTTGTIAGHRFFSIDAGKFLYNTECVGHLIRMADGSAVRLVSAEKKYQECKYYNIITKFHMNLFANGILTSFHLNNEMYQIDADKMKFIKDGHPERDMDAFREVPKEWQAGLRLSEQTGNANNILRDIAWRISISK